jgi:hypothetical protein
LTGAVDSEGATITVPAGSFLTAHGSVTMASDGSYTYTPNPGYVGSDSFTFTAQTDDDRITGTVNITVNAINDLTVVSPSISVNQNGSRSGNVLAGAVDIEGATITAVAGTFTTANGSVTIAADGLYTYTPNPGYSGSDSFTFTAQTDDDRTSGTVSVTVTADASDLTVATPQALTVNESTPGTGNVLTGAVDSEGATITAVAGTFATGHGSVTIAANGAYTYLPNPGYSGSDNFTFTAQTDDDSTSGTVVINIVSGPPVPSAPRGATRTTLAPDPLIIESRSVITFSTVRSKSALAEDATAVLYPAVRTVSSASGSSRDVQAPDLALRRPATVDDSNQPVWQELQRRLDGALGIQALDQVDEDLRVWRGGLQDGFALHEGLAADADDVADLVARVTLDRCR